MSDDNIIPFPERRAANLSWINADTSGRGGEAAILAHRALLCCVVTDGDLDLNSTFAGLVHMIDDYMATGELLFTPKQPESGIGWGVAPEPETPPA